MKIDFHDALQSILAEHPEYSPDAYRFLYLATNPTAGAVHDTLEARPPRHLSAREYHAAVCNLALKEFGPMARSVFNFWGLKTTQDIANATYYLIDAGIFSKQRHETKEDFLPLPDLGKTLEKPILPPTTTAQA